jgi:hypothetical protein
LHFQFLSASLELKPGLRQMKWYVPQAIFTVMIWEAVKYAILTAKNAMEPSFNAPRVKTYSKHLRMDLVNFARSVNFQN